MSSPLSHRLLSGLVCVLCGLAATATARATTFTPVPVNTSQGEYVSGKYQMQVDDGSGGNLTTVSVVHHFVTISGTNIDNAYYGNFAFGGGQARVTITLTSFTGSSVFTPTLSPLSAGVPITRISGTNQVQFTIQKGQPGYFMLKVTDSANTYPCNLIIIADPPETDFYTVPASSGTGIFNITSYGATDGYSADCAGAINQAISAAHSYYTSTGLVGTVYVPNITSAGSVYKISSSIVPLNGTQLYLPPGTVIRADTNYLNWPDYVPGGNKAAYMIKAGGNGGTNPYTYLENFTVYGRGTLDCKGIATGGGQPFGSTFLRMAIANIKDAQQIKFLGVVCREALAITFDMDRDENVAFIDTKVINYGVDHNYRENDGMDLYQCQNSTANHCFIFTADDAVALKGAYDASDGVLQSINNVAYNDMVVWTTVNGLKFGNATYTPITNSYFANSNIVSAEYGISIEANSASSQKTVSNLGFYNNRAENVTSKGVRVENTQGYISISNITISDYTCDTSVVSNITANTTNGGSIGPVSFLNFSLNGNIVLNNTAARMTVSSGASQPTYVAETNLIAGLSPTSVWPTGIWSTTANQTVAALTDGNTATQAAGTVTDSQAQVTYNLGATKWINQVQVFQDYGSFDVQYWKVEYYNGSWHPLFPAAVINFDAPSSLATQFFTTAGVNGWNVVGFPPVQGSQIRITFQPSPGDKVGVNEVAVYGH